MTNKSLSQQICEACGIEPIKLYGCEFKNLRVNGIEWGVDVCPAAEEESIRCEHCEHSKVASFLYPDFCTNNNNFVKLGELKIKTTKKYHTLFEMLSLECNFTNKKDFLEFLVNHINDKKYYSGSYIFTFRDIIKKSIKNEQWEV